MKKLLHAFVILFCIVFFSMGNTFAEQGQEFCFEVLKENAYETGIFDNALSGLEDMDYTTLESQFSRYYKNTATFGVELNEPLFELRLYSFGEQTGYTHPPFTPFKNYEATEKWDAPAKEFIVAEEYITNLNGEREFLSCSLMSIESYDLMNVTADNYLYDGEILSMLKTDSSLDYKAWYNTNISYDYNDFPFVTWHRLFIYPESTKNSFFSKFDIIDSFPTNISTDFTDLGNKLTSSSVGDGANATFPLYSFYQAIENTYPDISDKLALQGEIKFDTLKRLMTTQSNENFTTIWNTILDPRGLTRYMKAKRDGVLDQIPEGERLYYEANEYLLENMDEKITMLLDENNIEPIEDESNIIDDGIIEVTNIIDTELSNSGTTIDDTDISTNNTVIYLIITLIVCGLLIGSIMLLKNKKSTNK